MLKASAQTTRVVFAVLAGGMAILAIALRLRALPFSADPSLCASVETIGAFLTFTFTANALVRFRGTRDRIALILAMGFGVVGLMQLAMALQLFHNLDTALRFLNALEPSWLQSSMLLAEAMLLASALERPLSHSLQIAARRSLALMALAGTVALRGRRPLPVARAPVGNRVLRAPSRSPLQLLPALLYLLAAAAFRQRLKTVSSGLDQALAVAAWMNVAAHLVAMVSLQALDAPFTLAQTLARGELRRRPRRHVAR